MVRSVRFQQNGISLISLMIGLLVSLLAVMGMMALYRTVMHTTTESAAYARLSGDRSAALLAAHSYLQEAGFGVEDAALGTDLGLCTPAESAGVLRGGSCAADGRGNLLLWRVTDGAMRCAGLHVTSDGGLVYLQPQTCTGLSAAGWPSSQRQALFTPGSTAGGFVALELTEEPCQALGVAGEGAVRARLESAHPVAADPGAGNASVPIYSTICLLNFR
jgi:Tfp pilus assembly protein PilX